ncbi:hypothetical protein E4U43_004910 [Claviceps pusilla]|uniref:Ankyrin n=1 Tax=Claviceps pusilla TaxID=123648 RepID=A0A9P7N4W2_9HYPO|nr:hypothetical protein E4U43_004910 [Claviceps pusilla]
MYGLLRGAEKQLGDLATKLVAACKSGALPTVRSIAPKLYAGTQPLAANPSTQLPPLRAVLATAAENGRVDIMRYLMTNMPDCINARQRWSPKLPYPREQLPQQWKDAADWEIVVERAVESSHIPVVQLLLDQGMEVDYVLDRVGTILYLAIVGQDAAMARFLLDKGADPNEACFPTLQSYLSLAAERPSCDVLVELLDHGAKIPGSQALLAAAKAGNIATAEVLLARGADVNEVVLWNLGDEPLNLGTALHSAAEHGKTDMVAFLLKHGARTDLKNGGKAE